MWGCGESQKHQKSGFFLTTIKCLRTIYDKITLKDILKDTYDNNILSINFNNDEAAAVAAYN